MKDLALYKQVDISDRDFPVEVSKCSYKEVGPIMELHWHNHIQFYYFLTGRAALHLNSKVISVTADDIIIINSNELHYLENLCDRLEVYIIRIDFSTLLSNEYDICNLKYISPIIQSKVLFSNKVSDAAVHACICNIIEEDEKRGDGCELAFKGNAYTLLSVLFRKYCIRRLNEKESAEKLRRLEQFKCIFEYIEAHYSERITLQQLAEILNISRHHFCRLFKSTTGRSAVNYINEVRVEKAYALLRQGTLNVTEVAMATGFDDANYFSRLFKVYKKISPSQVGK